MAGNIGAPFFRSPFTDLTGSLVNHQQYDKCGNMEMQMMECMEAYGYERGKLKCKDLIEDFHECYTMRKQILRWKVSISEFLSSGVEILLSNFLDKRYQSPYFHITSKLKVD